MTVTAATSAKYPEAVASFEAIGWTGKDWDDLHVFFVGAEWAAGEQIANWLCKPHRFLVPVTPAQIRGLYQRHPFQAVSLLDAFALGAPERFLIAVLAHSRTSETPHSMCEAWKHARNAGLEGPAVTAWAELGAISSRSAAGIRWWVNQFGQDAYLYPMAGFTFDEAAAMQTAGTTPSNQQLKVMAVLNEYDPPA